MNNFKPLYNVSENDLTSYIKKSEKKLSKKETVKKLLQIRDYYTAIGDKNSVKLINKIIGNTKYHKKIVFINDGSYRNSRIWIHSYKNCIAVELYNNSIRQDCFFVDEHYDKSLEVLKYIMNNYEKIFIQLSYNFDIEHNSFLFDRLLRLRL